MSPINLDSLKTLLREYVIQSQQAIEVILIGGLALQAYGVHDRVTVDVDGELAGELEPQDTILFTFRKTVELFRLRLSQVS